MLLQLCEVCHCIGVLRHPVIAFVLVDVDAGSRPDTYFETEIVNVFDNIGARDGVKLVLAQASQVGIILGILSHIDLQPREDEGTTKAGRREDKKRTKRKTQERTERKKEDQGRTN